MTLTMSTAMESNHDSEHQWAVETHGLTKRFGENIAVNGVELRIPRGCAFGYLGPNGAGKTTLIRVLLGLTHADAGTMQLLGHSVPRHRAAALAGVGAIVDEPRFHGHLTGRQNLQILAAAREPEAKQRIGPSLERVGILHRSDDKVSKYSMGMRQRLGVAACLIGDPQLLILDEPMNGLDPAGMQDMRDMILSLVAEGRTVVLSSHLLDEVERTCDAVAIVDRGKVIRQGAITDLLAGSSFVVEIECSEPSRASEMLKDTAIGGRRRDRVPGPGDHAAGGNRARRHRRDQPGTGGRRNLRVPAPRGADLTRVMVPTSHQSIGGVRMTATADVIASAPAPIPLGHAPDRRGSWIPTGGMITTRFMELRKRRGLMVALIFVTIGIPTVFLTIRLLAHAFAPKSYGPAGGEDIFNALVAGVLYVFGFIVAATLGCTAGSVDLTEGMFRHLVVTGRSRLALYLARIPAGLAIVVPLVAIGFTIVCAVCVFAAPTQISYQGVSVPAGLSQAGLEHWAADHPNEVVCGFPYQGSPTGNVGNVLNNTQCGGGPGGGPGIIRKGPPGSGVSTTPTPAMIRAAAVQIAGQNYAGYSKVFLSPSVGLMVRTGLWIELEVIVGFVVGLGLGSLLGQRTVAVILMIVLEIVLTPILLRANIPHMINLQRSVVGLAVAHLEPSSLGFVFGGGGGPDGGRGTSLLVPESRTTAVSVIIAWLVGWTALGAWRMVKRDA